MVFTELRFPLFFFAVFCVHWLLRRNRARKLWLLFCSCLFYAAWDWRFLALLFASIVLDYVVGLQLGRPGARRKAWITLSLIGNLGLLGVFKYFGFFAESLAGLLSALGFEPHLPTLALVLPVGISFYTFQTLSYALDVYFKKLEPVRSLVDFALFVSFFPQLVAGPIVRAADFLPQLGSKRLFSRVDVRAALVLFLAGFVKKACISDNLAPAVDEYFVAPSAFSALGAWTAALYYSIQIYCDFSGYSDMAIACAALLGYRLRLNFDFPYFAGSISAFWRRWHISLSTWLRDYLYIPLGGSRGSRLASHRNLMLTMLLGGLWHGAQWNFVLWGGLHGLALVAHKEWDRRLSAGGALRRSLAPVAPLATFAFVCVTFVLFRAPGLESASTALQSVLFLESPGARDFGRAFLWIVPGLAFAHWISYRGFFAGWWKRLPDWAFASSLGALAAAILAFVQPRSTPFIYFQF